MDRVTPESEPAATDDRGDEDGGSSLVGWLLAALAVVLIGAGTVALLHRRAAT